MRGYFAPSQQSWACDNTVRQRGENRERDNSTMQQCTLWHAKMRYFLFFAPGVGFHLYTDIYNLHFDTAAQKDHCGQLRI